MASDLPRHGANRIQNRLAHKNTDRPSGYGAAGSLIVLLVWVYYSAQIFLLGAEFTWQYAQRFGSLKDGPRRPSLATATERQAGEGSSLRSIRASMEDANAAKSQEWQEGLMTPIVAIYVEEIVRAATGAGDGGQPTATAIADAAEKAFVHFKTSAGRDKQKQRALLSELSGSLTVAEQSGRYSAATRELIRFGVAYVDIYCKA